MNHVTHNRATHLNARNAFFYGNLLVERKGSVKRRTILICVCGLRNTDGAAAAGRLYKHGIATACLHHARLVLRSGTAIEHLATRRANTSRCSQTMRGILIHAHRACQHATAYIRHAAGFERSLHRAVLTTLAVQHRQCNVNYQLAELALDKLHKAAARLLAASRDQNNRSAVMLLPSARYNVCHIARVVKP